MTRFFQNFSRHAFFFEILFEWWGWVAKLLKNMLKSMQVFLIKDVLKWWARGVCNHFDENILQIPKTFEDDQLWNLVWMMRGGLTYKTFETRGRSNFWKWLKSMQILKTTILSKPLFSKPKQTPFLLMFSNHRFWNSF
jgi:hypothetical protein